MFKKLAIIILNLLLMFGIVLGVTLYWLPGWLNDVTGHENRVVVPAVIGQTAEDAVSKLESTGLRPMIIDTVYSDGALPGEVIEQLPEGNLPVKPGRIVYLTINAFDVQKVAFPEVLQWSSRQAQSHLRELRFVADSIIYEPYEFDDLVLEVTNLETRRKMVVGDLYPVRTHVVLHVGSTTLEVEGKNEESEDSFFQ